MDVKQMKENLLGPGEEGIFSSKVLPSTPRQPTVTMATPRKPLMDLSQVPRPSQDDLKASVTKNKTGTPLFTPQSKKSKRFPQPSSLVYQDKEQDNSRKQSDQVVKDALTDTDEEAEASDHNQLNQSIDNGDLDNFITSVLNKCVIDIQNNNLDENYTNGSYVEIDTSINTLETGQYHADCVNDEVKTKQTDERVQPTEANELNFSDSESYEDHTYCVKKDESSEKKEYLKNEKMSSDHNYFAKESIISPLSNDNINNEITNTDKSDHTYCAGQSNMYVPVETNLVSSDAQGQEDIVHSDVDTLVKDGVCSSENLIVATPEKPVCQVMLDRVSDDFEFDQKTGFTNGVADTNEDLSENIETDSFCENSTSEWMTDNPVCLSQNSSLISDTLNPQGVTYIKSLNADSETGGSPWKQTVTSPTCTMNYQDQSVFDHICVSAEKFEESQHKPILESPLVNEKLEVCSEYVLNVDSYLMEESFNDRDKTIIMGESVNNLVKTPLAPSSSKSPLSKDSSSVTSNLTNSELKKEILVNGDPTNSEIDGMSVATDSTEKNVRINCINESVSESPVVVDQTYLYSEYVLSMDSYLGDVSPEDQKISSELILNTKTEDVPADRESTLPKILYSPTLEPSNIPVASYLGETVEDAPCLKEDNFLKVISDSCSKEIGSLKSSSPLAESPSQIEKSSLCSDYVLHVDSYIVDELTCELDRSTTPVSERLEDTADLTLIDSTLTNTTMPSPDHANVIDTLSETVSEVDQRSSLKDCINTSTCINPSVHVSSGSVLEIMFNNLSSSMVESTIEEDKSLNTTMECHNKAVSMDTIDRKSTIEEIKSLDTIMECQNKAVSMDTVDRKSTIEEDKSLDTTMECHNKAVSMDTVDRKSTIEEDKSLDTTIECHNKAVSLDTVDRKSTIEEDKSLDTIIECQNKAVSMDTVDRKSTIEEDKSLDTTIECHNKAVSLDTIDRKSTIEEDKSLDTIMECQNKAVSMDTVDRKSTIEEDKSLDVIMECHNKAVSIDTVDRKSTIEEDKSLDTIMECHNKAVSMDTVDRKSASCSPIPLSMCDVSVQNIPDTHSAINSPFIVNEIKNTSVNTDITDTDDANVGTETPATIYVNIIKDQTEVVDKCIITDKTVMSEMWTNTDNHDGVSVGVEARPELETVYTEMVDLPMMTVGTSMTPVKLANKFGKRLTAEDIRRQHPRAVANQLETLKLQNEHLEAQVRSLEHEREKLKTSVKDSKASLRKAEKHITDVESAQDQERNKIWVSFIKEHLEAQVRSQEHERSTSVEDSKASLRKAEKHITDVESAQDQERNKIWEMTNHSEDLEKALREQTQTHDCEIEELNRRLAEFEQEKTVMKKEYADEIENMKKKYEENNYHDHFLASQKLVRQLQLELSQYTQLLDDIEQSHKIQENLEEKMLAGVVKIKLAGETMLSLHRTLNAREQKLSAQQSDLERQQETLEEKMSAGVVKIKLAGETILSLHRTLNAREQKLSAQQSDFERQGITLMEELAKIQTEREVMQAKLEEDEAKLRVERDQMQEMLKEEQGKITAEREQMEVAVKEDEARIKSERVQMLISVNEERARVAAEREQMMASVKEEETRVKSEREQMLESIKEEEVRIKSEREQMQESVKEEEMRINSEREQMLASISEEETRIKTEREQMLASVTEEETRVKSEREQMQEAMEEEEARVRAEREQMKKELGEEKTKLRKDFEQMEYSLMTRVTAEREEMQKIVKCCKVEMEELDDLYQRTCKDLEAANTKTTSLLADFEDVKAELTSRGEEKNLLESKVEELRQTNQRCEMELVTLQTTLKHSQELAGDTNNRLSECQDLLHKEREETKKAKERLNMEKINLQRTLDSREQDIDVLEKDVFECREIIYSQMEKLRLAEEKEKSTEAELKSREVQNMELRGCCAALRGKEQELLENLRFTKEELLGTRDHASRLLKEQGTEMANCSAVIGELTDHMTTVLSGLNKKAGIQKTPSKAAVEEIIVKPHDPNVALDLSKPPHIAAQSQSSLVSQILSAAMSQDSKNLNGEVPVKTQNEAETDLPVNQSEKNDKESITVGDVKEHSLDGNSVKMDSPGTISRKNLGFSGNSAFAPVKSGVLSESAKSSVTSHSSSATGQTVQQTDANSTEVVKESDSLPDQVNKALEVFTEINRLISLIEKASRSALQDMRSENNELNSRLSQCEFTERRLQADLEYHRKELEMSKGLCVELREKLEEMGDRLGQYLEQESEIKRLQQEMGHLHGKIQSLEAEKEFQNDQMKELLERLEQSSDATQPPGLDVNSQKEILTLQKKVHKLREQLQEKHNLIEEISNKASRRIQKLEDNWKKADKEVLRFDELVDTVRHSLVKNEALMKDEDIRKVVRLIDGQEQVSSFKKGGQLKPIKTSTW